jgi:thioredoxin reductase
VKIIIVGAGIGGLIAHLVCRRAGLLARLLGSTTLGVADGLARYETKRKERVEMIVAASRRKAEAMHAADPRVYTKLYAAIRSSSITETMQAQQELLEAGPFG